MAENPESFQERTEPATPKRREDSRRKGKVAKSMEMNSALLLVTGLLILSIGGSALASQLEVIAQRAFSTAGNMPVNATTVHHIVQQVATTLAVTLGPVVLALMAIGLVTSFAQVGFLFTLEPLLPQWSKLNPLKGLKRIVASRRSLVEMIKNLFKVFLLGVIGYSAVSAVLVESLELMDGTTKTLVSSMASSALGVGLKVGLAFLVLAAFDYLYQRYEYEQELKMTKQEVKEEGKMLEGDPLIKGRIKRIQRQIAYKRMMQDVPKASVVITNPTHYAVALKYDALKMSAPKVVAKGADLIARRIRDIALASGIPIVEDKLLARTLYTSVEVGDLIPEKLFQAVAQVLAYVFRMKSLKPGPPPWVLPRDEPRNDALQGLSTN